MLICISPNPAIDRRVRLDDLRRGAVNRVSCAKSLAGGKAAHVAMAARALGEDVLWIGFVGGSLGEELESGLSDLGIPTAAVRTKSSTRLNLEIIERNGAITEILEPGGAVTPNEIERFFSVCRDVFAESEPGTQVALSGSLPPGAPADTYAELTRIAHAHDFFVLLDASGEALSNALHARPDFVKPNGEEASLFAGGKPVDDDLSAAQAASRLISAGAKTVAVSLGARGMYWHGSDASQSFLAKPPIVDQISTVGCGDAALAGFAVARKMRLGAKEAVKLSVACGSANCTAAAPGMIDRETVEKLVGKVSVHSTADATSR